MNLCYRLKSKVKRMSEQDKEEDLNNMAASYRAQTGHLTRTVKAANALVKEADLRPPSRVFLEQLKRVLAAVCDQEAKCAAICEDIRDAQDQTEANEEHIKGCLTRDAEAQAQVTV
jgi:5-formyltetrahydrofolate cyclo-ligase